MCPSLFFHKVAGLRPGIFLKIRDSDIISAKSLRMTFLIEHHWLILHRAN